MTEQLWAVTSIQSHGDLGTIRHTHYCKTEERAHQYAEDVKRRGHTVTKIRGFELIFEKLENDYDKGNEPPRD